MPYDVSLIGPVAMALIASLMRRRLTPRWARVFAVWVTLILAATVFLVWPGLTTEHWRSILIVVIDVVAATSAWDSVFWLAEHPHMALHRYYLWWALFWVALLAIALAHNLALAWLAVEFSTLASGALVVEMGDRHALEAAWKYIVIASVGLVLGLIGIVFLYASLQGQRLGWATLNYSNLQAHFMHIPSIIRQLATILLISGFGTKAGLVPFHTWLPDAHSEAPSPVSGLLSGVLLGLSLFTVARVVQTVPVPSTVYLSGNHLFTIFGTISVVVGSLALLVQRDIKRLLAYSSIEQVGLIAVALGVGTKAAFMVALWQFVLHAVIKSSLFYGAGHLTVVYHTKQLDKITGLMSRHPVGAIFWALGILALAGLPPLGLAYTEWQILTQLLSHQAMWVAILLFGALTLTFAALGYHLMRTLWGPVDMTDSGQTAPPAERVV